MADRWRLILREPLLHFALLGAALFVGYDVLHPARDASSTHIVVDAARMHLLSAQFQLTWQRAPSASEMSTLVDDFIREEIWYREGVARGLDRDDPIVRSRMRTKLQFFGDGRPAPEPTEADLRAWLDTHAESYAIPEKSALQQVFIDPTKHGPATSAIVERVGKHLHEAPESFVAEGDATLLPGTLPASDPGEIAALFGGPFAEALHTLPIGAWAGPVRSAYGLHWVRITGREAGRAPVLADVRDAVERDWTSARDASAKDAWYRELRQRYVVDVDDAARAGTSPTAQDAASAP